MTYRQALLKKKVELVLMWPFVFLGKIAGRLFPLKTNHRIFLFFPSADIGGAIKVNADITACIREQKPLIIFSKKPKNNQFMDLFRLEGVRILSLHPYVDNKLFHFVNFFFRGVLAAWINKSERPVVFGGEGLFFYKMLPHLQEKVKTIELCHLNSWFNYSQAFITDMDTRIFSTPKIKRDVEAQYSKNGIEQKYFDRLLFIDNKINIPPYEEKTTQGLEVIFVGRGAPQKRVYLIAAIAKRLHEENSPVHFSFVGDVEAVVPAETASYCTLYGNVKDEKKLHEIYREADILLLTSAYEGLPIVVMDMMARGKIVISTAVDGIPDYITHGENGLLIREEEETAIVEKAIELIKLIEDDPELKKAIGQRAYQYAQQHFSEEHFDRQYTNLFK